MFKNYLKVALRSLIKSKWFTLLNIAGLAVGMTLAGIFTISVGIKLRSDRFHEKSDRIYGLIQILENEDKIMQHTAYTDPTLKSDLLDEIPDIEKIARIRYSDPILLEWGDKVFIEDKVIYADGEFLEIFDFKLLGGDRENSLNDPGSIILTSYFAAKIFGSEDPLGKNLIINDQPFTVSGVMENIPRYSSLKFNYIISMNSLPDQILESKKIIDFTSFVLLRKDADQEQVNHKLELFTSRHYIRDDPVKRNYLFPLEDFRLHSEHIRSPLSSGSITALIIMVLLGGLLLMVVSINFINLSIARYMKRINEIGIRKIIGASRLQLIIQFLGESILLALISVPVALTMFEVAYPIFMRYLLSDIMPHLASNVSGHTIISHPFIIKYFFYTALFVGLVAGIYPAVYQSGLDPISAFKGLIRKGKNKKKGIKILIIMQFLLAIVFIMAAAVMKDQVLYIFKADFGFDRSNVATLNISKLNSSQREVIRQRISRNPAVLKISASEQLPVFWIAEKEATINKKDREILQPVEYYGVGHHFIELMEIDLLQGRSFGTGDKSGIIINQVAVDKFGWENPIGKVIRIDNNEDIIIGIVDNSLFGDIGTSIPPAVYHLEEDKLNYLLVKYSGLTGFPEIEKYLTESWKQIMPAETPDITTLDDYFEDTLGFLIKIGNFMNLIGLISIFFSCLGLIGLTAYVVQRRTKEIGIRKVMGASFSRIFWVLSREFIILVTIAYLVGILVIRGVWEIVLRTGTLFIQEISFTTYIGVFCLSVLLSLIAVGTQSYRAACSDPVRALKYE